MKRSITLLAVLLAFAIYPMPVHAGKFDPSAVREPVEINLTGTLSLPDGRDLIFEDAVSVPKGKVYVIENV